VKLYINESEVVQTLKDIKEQPDKFLEMVKADMLKVVAGYLIKITQL